MQTARHASRRPWRGRLAALLLGSIASLVLVELALRALLPQQPFLTGEPMPHLSGDPARFAWQLVIDPEVGYRPVLGGLLYDEFAAKHHAYALEKRPGVERIAFLGDSVTSRGQIVEGLRQIAGEERYEYWNCGVEGYNTEMEVAAYVRWSRAIDPDHVILSFHLNDFEDTPVAFKDADGQIVVFVPDRPMRDLSPWLLAHSHFYRLVLRARLQGRSRFELSDQADRVRASLRTLRDVTRQDGAALTVLLLPLVQPVEAWPRQALRRRDLALAIFEELGLEVVDLLPALQDALARGVDVQEFPGDVWHTSDALGEVFAEHLLERGLL